jgi:3-hydroxyisobutyrate dehydrogenase-like beta-hydroxyacid dehydrogenase
MTDRTDAPVTVIGLGPMGQAMARALMDGGHPVTYGRSVQVVAFCERSGRWRS